MIDTSNYTPKTEPKSVAEINTKRMYMILLKAQEMTLQETPSKKGIIQLLSSLEHDILLLNDENNHIERDLFH